MRVPIELPPEVVEMLKRIAYRRGKPVEELIVYAIVEDLDVCTRVELYLKLFEKYFAEAEELYGKGDPVQAGEKYWSAVTALLSALAERRGWAHYTHRDLWDVVENLVEETGESRALDAIQLSRETTCELPPQLP